MKLSFYSKGKLLLTGEYVILDGAIGIALPTKKGQSLIVESNDSGHLVWQSFDCQNKIWFETKIETKKLLEKQPPKGNSKYDKTLFKILWEAQQMNANFLNEKSGYQINTHLEFERLACRFGV